MLAKTLNYMWRLHRRKNSSGARVVIGRNWRFMILEDSTYATSDAYVASQDDNIRDIYRILKTLRRYIQNRIPAEEMQKAAAV